MTLSKEEKKKVYRLPCGHEAKGERLKEVGYDAGTYCYECPECGKTFWVLSLHVWTKVKLKSQPKVRPGDYASRD